MSEPLQEALVIQRAAALDGFDWRDLSELWAKLAEEIGELQEAASQGPERIRDELGDLLFMAVNLARHLGADPAAALAQANQKFQRRYAHVMKEPESLPAVGQPDRLDAMEARWQDAKRLGL